MIDPVHLVVSVQAIPRCRFRFIGVNDRTLHHVMPDNGERGGFAGGNRGKRPSAALACYNNCRAEMPLTAFMKMAIADRNRGSEASGWKRSSHW